MKRVYIIRHAKSSWKDLSLRDVERPLNNRGKNDAPLMARVMFEKNYKIDYIYLSPSRRTRDTSKYFIKEFDIPKERIIVEESLYHGYPEDFENIIYSMEENKNNVAFFGHNPGITVLANNCIGRPIYNVPTTGIIVLESNAEIWPDFNFESSTMIDCLFPKQYK